MLRTLIGRPSDYRTVLLLADNCSRTSSQHGSSTVATTRTSIPGARGFPRGVPHAPLRNQQASNVAKDPHISFAVKTEDARFVLNNGRLTVDGSFITEVHLVTRVGPRETVKLAKASFWASQLMEENWGWKVINGSCGVVDDRDRGRAFTFGARGSKRCYELSIAMDTGGIRHNRYAHTDA